MNHDPDLQQQQNQQTYLLLEKSNVVDVRQTLYQHENAPQWVPLFAGTQWAVYMGESPTLIQAHPKSSIFKWAIGAMANSDSLRGLIVESPGELDVVADWSRQRLTVNFDESRTGLLRFYDPLVWEALAPQCLDNPAAVTRVHYWQEHAGNGGWAFSDNPEFVIPGNPAKLDKARANAIRRVRA
ncbi:hypothetical protein LCGC14_2127250 [marine sediment metagenome]|uniref:DUF4123 domain-containing protein n=2 Tax=root TaxID=1 RepID=A0A831VW40_9GAMM|nr:DUF4123 domain-containing protein [Marinobacter antarcticus]HEA52754.1 DUF4123 domain-containing protein [Marinobacter antarcticus]